MLYSKDRAANISKSDIKYIPAGINEDVVLQSAKCEKSQNGNYFLEISFTKNGATLTHTEWEPKMTNFITTEEALQAKADNQYSRMLQILTCFYPETALNFNGETFKEFAEWIAGLLNAADKNKKLRVKVVYNNKGYTTLPSYAKYTFIEPMELPEGKTSAIAELNIDKFTRPVVADAETSVENPFAPKATFETQADKEDSTDLPF